MLSPKIPKMFASPRSPTTPAIHSGMLAMKVAHAKEMARLEAKLRQLEAEGEEQAYAQYNAGLDLGRCEIQEDLRGVKSELEQKQPTTWVNTI